MKEVPMLSLEAPGTELELQCREETTVEPQVCSAVWGGKGISTSALWGRRVASKPRKSPKSTTEMSTLEIWGGSTID
jgi:hypothetical protein